MSSRQVWLMSFPHPLTSAGSAARAEAEGFDGVLFPDTQGISGDPYVALALAARATDHIGLGTGVTNPYTRHPAVTASAIASVQAESGGRAVLGIGRGNSALAFLGLAPSPLTVFERYIEQTQRYLAGEAVEPTDPSAGMRSLATLDMAVRPASRLQWLPRPEPKVPLDVAATGRRHAQAQTDQAGVLTDEFVDHYAVVGSAERCAERLRRLFDLGLDRVVLFHASMGSEDSDTAASRAGLVNEVLPALRAGW